MAKSPFLDFLNGYETPTSPDGTESVTGRRFFVRSYSGSITKARRKSLFTRSVAWGDKFSRLVSYTCSKAYGAFLLAFGLFTFVLYFLSDYLEFSGSEELLPLMVGIVSSLVAIPFLLSDKPLATLISDNEVTDFIIYEFLCIKRVHGTENEVGIPVWVMALVGGAIGALGFFVPMWIILLSLGAALFIYLTFLSPEFSFFISLMALPYLSLIPYYQWVFAGIIALTLLSLIRKGLCGKRVLFFEQYDFLLSAMLILILISGIFVKGIESFTSSLIMIAMALGYFLASNLLSNRRLADGAMNAIVISSLPAAGVAVYQLVREISGGTAATLVGRGISSTFETTGAYAVFIIVAILFAAALAKQSSGAPRVAYWLMIALNIGALVMTGEVFAVFALVFSIVAYYALKTGWFAPAILIILSLVPYLILALPEALADRVLAIVPEMTTLEGLKETWLASLTAFSHNISTGIGIGAESFALEMESYGITDVLNSGNIFIELGLEAGVGALLCFAVMLLVRMRHRAVYYSHTRHTSVGAVLPFSAVVIFALIFLGSTEYIWADNPSFYLFWCVFGIGSASLRISKRQLDDRVLYYEDTRDVDYSAIDIEIK
ncbi:MAG: hypothetical protein IJ459_06925 [Clostridia bacterium]|nr:hypothetical protein [Clostridia bacterium]